MHRVSVKKIAPGEYEVLILGGEIPPAELGAITYESVEKTQVSEDTQVIVSRKVRILSLEVEDSLLTFLYRSLTKK